MSLREVRGRGSPLSVAAHGCGPAYPPGMRTEEGGVPVDGDGRTPWEAAGEELLSLRDAFLSREVLRTFSRYVAGQRRKLDADVRTHGAPRWKHAMHLLRLQRSCRDLLRTGRLVVKVGEAREELLAVRRGEWSWDRVAAALTELDAACEEAALTTPLPAAPDRARVADFLYRVRRDSAAALG